MQQPMRRAWIRITMVLLAVGVVTLALLIARLNGWFDADPTRAARRFQLDLTAAAIANGYHYPKREEAERMFAELRTSRLTLVEYTGGDLQRGEVTEPRRLATMSVAPHGGRLVIYA